LIVLSRPGLDAYTKRLDILMSLNVHLADYWFALGKRGLVEANPHLGFQRQ